jgi:hypothetical protein
MTQPDIVIDYLADHPELVGELARLSWKEWQEVYQRREQTLEHSLKNYRERMNTNRLPLALVAVRALHGESLTGRAANCGPASELDLKLVRFPTLSSPPSRLYLLCRCPTSSIPNRAPGFPSHARKRR